MRYLPLSAIALTPIIFLTSCHSLGGSPGVKVSISNKSGKSIETVEFWRDPTNNSLPVLLEATGPLKIGEKKTVILSPFIGEGSYLTQVTFVDGEQIAGGAEYVEGGYRVLETVKETEVISEIDIY